MEKNVFTVRQNINVYMLAQFAFCSGEKIFSCYVRKEF